MHAVLIVLLLVSSGEADSPVTRAMARAARRALGPEVELRVEERSDDEALPVPTDGEAIVSVRWDAHGTSALLRLRDAQRSIDRRVTFSAADAAAERGRTLGFVVASMVPDRVAEPPPIGPPPVAPPTPIAVQPETPPRTPESPRIGRAPVPARVASGPARTTRVRARARPRAVSPPRRRLAARSAPVPRPVARALPAARAPVRVPTTEWRGAIEATGSVAIGVGDDDGSSSFGGAVAGSFWPTGSFALRLELEARSGNIAAVAASTLWLSATVGAAWSFLQIREPFFLDVELRADIGVARQSFTHFSADDLEPSDEEQFLGVADTAVALRLRITDALAIVAAVGVELPFTSTDIYVREQRRATVGAPRLSFGLGIAAGF